MPKEFDVHFIIKFSDFISSVEAETKEEAKIKATDIIHTKQVLIDRFAEYIDSLDFELELTDILEVGVDI